MAVLDRREAKVDFLLEKGMEILWAKGFTATSVNDIVRSAEVPKGSFYFYFDSKEDFVLKALDKYFKQMFGPAVAILRNKDLSPKKRLIAFFEFRINFLKEELDCQRGCMACNISSEVSEHNDAIRKKIASIHKKMNNAIVKVAKEAQDLGEIDKNVNVKDLIEFIEDAGRGAMVSMKEMKSSYPVDNVFNMVKTILLK